MCTITFQFLQVLQMILILHIPKSDVIGNSGYICKDIRIKVY